MGDRLVTALMPNALNMALGRRDAHGVIHHQAAIAFFPRRRARFGRGPRCPGHRRSSNPSGALVNPSRIAGVRPPDLPA